MKDNQNTGTKERSALFLLLFYQPDGKNKEYIAERAGTFVSNDGKPHPIRSVFVYASKHDAQRSFHANSLVFAEGCIYNRNEEYTKYMVTRNPFIIVCIWFGPS